MSSGYGLLAALAALLLCSCSRNSFSEARPELAGISLEVFASGLTDPEGLAFDSAGNLFVTLERDAPDGKVIRIGPNGAQALVAEGLSRPDGVVLDPDGQLVVSEEVAGGRILRLTTSGIAVVAEGLDGPEGLVFEANGDLLVTEDFGGRLLRITPAGGITSLAVLRKPEGIALDSAGRILIAESDADRIVTLGPDRAVEPVVDAGLRQPDGVAWDADCGCLFVGEDLESGARLVRVGPDGAVTTIVSGLNEAEGIAIGSDRAIYVAENGRGRILRVVGALAR